MNRWSWKVAEVAGIGIFVHPTFLLLLGWVALTEWLGRRGAAATLSGVLFVTVLFAIVVLHELGHALTAKRFGIRTRDITLLPIGGVARLERMPDDPRQELLVALAGPAVNAVISIALFALLAASNNLAALAVQSFDQGSLLGRLVWANVSLAVFNLLPAFPMDGGRVLRAFLALHMDYVRATQLAASIGQTLAFIFGFIGLFSNPFLVLIALFVWMGAGQEASAVVTRSILAGLPVSRAMITQFQTVAPGDTLARAVEHVLAGFQHDFPVMDNGRLAGVLTQNDLLAALAQQRQDTRVEEIMKRQFETVAPADNLETAFARLQASECPALPVLSDGQLVGILTAESVGEFLVVQEALRSPRRA